MPSDPDEPAGPAPDARAAMAQLRAGIARAREIMKAAKQAIGRPPPEGPVLADEPAPPPEPAAPETPDADVPVIPVIKAD
jgi:hypothetical protein